MAGPERPLRRAARRRNRSESAPPEGSTAVLRTLPLPFATSSLSRFRAYTYDHRQKLSRRNLPRRDPPPRSARLISRPNPRQLDDKVMPTITRTAAPALSVRREEVHFAAAEQQAHLLWEAAAEPRRAADLQANSLVRSASGRSDRHRRPASATDAPAISIRVIMVAAGRRPRLVRERRPPRVQGHNGRTAARALLVHQRAATAIPPHRAADDCGHQRRDQWRGRHAGGTVRHADRQRAGPVRL